MKKIKAWALAWKDDGGIVQNISGVDWIDGHLFVYSSREHAREVKTSNMKVVKVEITIKD